MNEKEQAGGAEGSEPRRPRAGWEEEMQRMAERGDDALLDADSSESALVARFSTPPTDSMGRAADGCYYVPLMIQHGPEDDRRYYASSPLLDRTWYTADTVENALDLITSEIRDAVRISEEHGEPVEQGAVLTAWLRVPGAQGAPEGAEPHEPVGIHGAAAAATAGVYRVPVVVTREDAEPGESRYLASTPLVPGSAWAGSSAQAAVALMVWELGRMARDFARAGGPLDHTVVLAGWVDIPLDE